MGIASNPEISIMRATRGGGSLPRSQRSGCTAPGFLLDLHLGDCLSRSLPTEESEEGGWSRQTGRRRDIMPDIIFAASCMLESGAIVFGSAGHKQAELGLLRFPGDTLRVIMPTAAFGPSAPARRKYRPCRISAHLPVSRYLDAHDVG